MLFDNSSVIQFLPIFSLSFAYLIIADLVIADLMIVDLITADLIIAELVITDLIITDLIITDLIIFSWCNCFHFYYLCLIYTILSEVTSSFLRQQI